MDEKQKWERMLHDVMIDGKRIKRRRSTLIGTVAVVFFLTVSVAVSPLFRSGKEGGIDYPMEAEMVILLDDAIYDSDLGIIELSENNSI